MNWAMLAVLLTYAVALHFLTVRPLQRQVKYLTLMVVTATHAIERAGVTAEVQAQVVAMTAEQVAARAGR